MASAFAFGAPDATGNTAFGTGHTPESAAHTRSGRAYAAVR
jgi:hypothetical protein